jgi:hypothetical protein
MEALWKRRTAANDSRNADFRAQERESKPVLKQITADGGRREALSEYGDQYSIAGSNPALSVLAVTAAISFGREAFERSLT